jgi:DNA-directed RNA polymerase specialized sigma24 family protein
METPTSGLDINRALDLRGFAAQVMPELVDEHRAVIEAIILNELSYCEAAEALNIPEGTLRSRFMAAKRVLGEHAKRLLPPSQRGPR